MSLTLASSVSSRLESQIRRVFSIVLLISLIELIANSSSQRPFLNFLSPLAIAILVLLTLATVASSWFGEGKKLWFLVHGWAVFFALVLWPLMVVDPLALEPGFKPWLWWTLGIGILGIGLFSNTFIGFFYLTLTSLGWILLHSSSYGGEALLGNAIQDGVYLFLFGGSVVGMINLVRRGAKTADEENSKAIASAIEQARVDAVERERQRLDALIHDRVLNTLLLAAKAGNSQEQENVAELAEQAIESLRKAAEEPQPTPSVTPLGLFRALRKAALKLHPEIEVQTLGGGSDPLPAEKAQAITEATLQAIDNAARHSKASKVELVFESPNPGEIKILVRDNGAGFRLDRIPKDRIGVRISILGRMRAIGGEAKIETSPQGGTAILLRWPK